MFELVDLHTHSHFSDGTLSPTALVDLAATRKVQLLALTDHDSTQGLPEAKLAAQAHGIKFVAGTEISCGWRGQEIHIVGLGFQPDDTELQQHLAHLQTLRRERLKAIGLRLAKHPQFQQCDVTTNILAGSATPTRMHVARAIVAQGKAKDTQDAFDRYLKRGGAGYVPQEWPGIETAIGAIVGAGGHAVLAHPHRYKLSAGALRNLCAEFLDTGGAALEVSLPGLAPHNADRLAGLAREFGLAGSAGSDFHEPGVPWRPLGRYASLPAGIEPLSARL
jgi:3',5'-nucleoside bisphosphate phosphatase